MIYLRDSSVNDATNEINVSGAADIGYSGFSFSLANLFATKSGNDKREAEADEIRSKSALNSAIAKRLGEPNATSGLGTPGKILIGVGFIGVVIGAILIAKRG